VDHLEESDEVDDLRRGEQAAETDHLDRQAAHPQRRLDDRELAACSAQDRGGRPAVVPVLGHEVGDRLGLLLERGAVDRVHRADAGGGPSVERRQRVGGVGRVQGRGRRVGDVEDREVVAPRGAQVVGGRTRAVVRTELVGEPRGAGCARPPPAVDGLVGVADGRDRVAGAEERREEPDLRVGGVLVLVEEDDLEARALPRGDSRHVLGELGCEGDLVAEVHGIHGALARLVGLDHVEEPAALHEGLGELDDVGVQRGPTAAERRALDGPEQPSETLPCLVDAEEVLAQGVGEVEHRSHDGRDRGVRPEVVVPALDDAAGDLPLARLGEEPGTGLPPDAEPVVLHERRGVGVVRRDGRAVERVEGSCGGAGACTAQLPQALGHPLGELARGLARERQTEDLLGQDVPVRDEPHDARGHRLRLAGAGPRDDEHGAQRGFDDGGLLGGRPVLTEEVRDLCRAHRLGCGCLRDHAVPLSSTPERACSGPTTCRPSPCSGQERRTPHIAHNEFSTAENPAPAIVSAASSTSVRAQLASGSPRGPCERRVARTPSLMKTSCAPVLRVPGGSEENAPSSTASW
jgi:hypothetical protein